LAGLGQSLGDLSLVDRSSERPSPSAKRVIDFDEVDRSVDEHIYENCREAIVKSIKVEARSPIYENFEGTPAAEAAGSKREKLARPDLSQSLSVPLTTSELERRAELLLSQLDEDDGVIMEMPVKSQSGRKIDLVACKLNIEKSKDVLSRSRENLTKSREELARSKESLEQLSKSQEALEKSRVLAKSQEGLQFFRCNKRPECEMSIQEIRRNWERQIKNSQVLEEDTTASKKRLAKSSSSINGGSRSDLALSLLGDTQLCKKSKKGLLLQGTAKRTKEIEQLVNFFNCKNTETSARKPSTVIQDSWPRLSKDSAEEVVGVKTTANDKSEKIEKMEKMEKSCGYASDGNSSEDSGHISNENEPDWKEEPKDFKNHRKTEIFLEGIVQDLDASLERTIEVFEQVKSTEPRVSQPPKNCASSSSGASSIDSWDEALKLSQKNAAKSVALPTPTQRKNLPKVYCAYALNSQSQLPVPTPSPNSQSHLPVPFPSYSRNPFNAFNVLTKNHCCFIHRPLNWPETENLSTHLYLQMLLVPRALRFLGMPQTLLNWKKMFGRSDYRQSGLV
jgi:hypothetical protein